MTSLFKTPKMPSPPPVPEPPTEIAMDKAAALAEESMKQVKKKKGRPSTIIGGGLASDTSSTSAKPTLMG
jgi:hypothetical protein